MTLGDFWGVELYLPELDDDKGISIVFIHTAKGNALWEEASHAVFSKPVSYEAAVQLNSAYYRSAAHHPAEKLFQSKIGVVPLETLIQQCCKRKSFLHRAAGKIKRMMKHALNHIAPS